MNPLSPFSKRFFGGLAALLILAGWVVDTVEAQNPYPGWAAPKRIPTKSDRATFPDIAAVGDTIHVIFRATYTFVADDQGIPPEELILDEIQLIQLLLRTNNTVQIEAMGGREKLRARRQQLMEELNQLQSRVDSGQAQPTSPVQTALYYTRSDDRGKTFLEDPISILSQPETFYGQTALYVDARGIHVGYTAEAGENVIHTFATHSEDGGKTWSPPQKLSGSNAHCYDPHMVGIPGGGLIMTWWEREETTTRSQTRRTFEGMQESLDQGLLQATERSQGRSIIKYARYVAGTWQTERLLAYSSQIVPYVNLAEGPNNQLFAHWIDRNGVECRISRDGGVTWETTLDFSQVLDPRRSNTFLWGGGDFHFIQGEAQLRRSAPLSYRKGLLQGNWGNIIDPQAQYSYPRFAHTKDEVQTVWGTTDSFAGQSILYFREDNKPPTSELVYPVDGAFTKPILVFLWDAVDDIATRMTYRWTIMQRENPADKPEPHNWFEYEAIQENPIDPLPDGYYTLFLQAKDFAGNEEPNPTQFDFQTYYVPPRIEADGKTLPPLEIETRNLELRWTAEDNTPGEAPLIAYRLDGNPVTEFARRESIKIRGLRQGWHQVQIFAKDDNGNIYPYGDTLSVRVNLSLMLNWQQRPQQPQQDGVVFVSGNTVPLSWIVTDNTEDQGTQFMSSIRYIYSGETTEWTAHQLNMDYEFSGEGGAPLREGPYVVQVIAQDEFGNAALGDRNLGNLAGAYIDAGFTVDRTPPSVEFNDLVVYNEETRIPTVTVVGKDNFTHDHNLKYQFRVITREEPDPAWSGLDPNPSFTAEGNPVKWYSWGYVIQARAQDILGNTTSEYAEQSLIWYDRNPALLYTLLGLAALVVLGVLYLMFSSLAEKRRQKKRTAAKREAAKQSSTGAVATAGAAVGAAAVGDEDDLFNVPEAATTKSGGADDLFGPAPTYPSAGGFGGGQSPPASPFDDPFSTSETTVFDDPFADAPVPAPPAAPTPSLPLDEDEPLEIGGGYGDSSSFDSGPPEPDPFKPPAPEPVEPPPPPKKSDWSADKKVELDDRDLFDPL